MLKDLLRTIPGVVPAWRGLQRLRHGLVLRLGRRRNYTFTQFCRLPTQVRELAGPVLDSIGGGDSPVRVLVFGCSIGAEAYSLGSELEARGRRWSMECFDIDAGVIARARDGVYEAGELSRRGGLPEGFIERTFDRTGDTYTVKAALRAAIRFEVGSVLDEELIGRLALAQLVLAQNFLYHLSRDDATRAFDHLEHLVARRGALAVDGADLDLRTRWTARAGLEPWPGEVERIHAEAREERGYAWPSIYWGLEPYDGARKDASRRYATIFVRPSGLS